MDRPGPSKSIEDFFLRTPVNKQQTSPASSSEASRDSPETSLELETQTYPVLSSESDAEPEGGEIVDEPVLLESQNNVRLTPHQPKNGSFPNVSVGNARHRSFQQAWFKKWPWLEWDDEKESAFCHTCRMAYILKFKISKS